MPRKRELQLLSPALIVIDMQRYFLDPRCDAFLKGGPSIIKAVLDLISAFRKSNRPVFYTRHACRKKEDCGVMSSWWRDKLPRDGDFQSELISQLKPSADEVVITKKKYSAFEGTRLKKLLLKEKIREVVICGVMTHLCVETTARHAFLLDFQPVVISDACASENKKYHNASLLNLGHGFAHIITAKELIKKL